MFSGPLQQPLFLCVVPQQGIADGASYHPGLRDPQAHPDLLGTGSLSLRFDSPPGEADAHSVEELLPS